MEYAIGGKAFTFTRDFKDDRKRRRSFDALAKKTFGLSFEQWYDAGYWTGKYQPYALLDAETVVANVSVNLMSTLWEEVPRAYVQLGTVMTDPAYRRLGLSRFLMRRVLEDWHAHCDAIYLFANDSVLDFYPKFGFVKAEEYQATLRLAPRDASVKKLDMADGDDVATLHRLYQKSNPFSELPMLDNWGLLMFYCADRMRNCVYYVQEAEAVLIAEQAQDTWTIYDVYGGQGIALTEIIGALAGTHPGCHQARLGFAHRHAAPEDVSLRREEGTTLFVYDGKENVFQNHRTMLPLLSHA